MVTLESKLHIFFCSLIAAFLCICSVSLCAQDVAKPELQIADRSFFDPTKVEKVKKPYHFGAEYRLEAGYIQNNQRSKNDSYPNLYLHGGQLGFKVDFLLPLHFSLQTGVDYALAYGSHVQHYADTSKVGYVRHRIYEHTLTIPVHAYYTQTLKKQWRMLFYAGPQLQLHLYQPDKVYSDLGLAATAWAQSNAVRLEDYDRAADELARVGLQFSLGGGFEWDRLRLTAGYNFGLNNMLKTKSIKAQHLWEWGWYVSFGVRLNDNKRELKQSEPIY